MAAPGSPASDPHARPWLPALCLVLAGCAQTTTQLPNPGAATHENAGFSVAIAGDRAIVGVARDDSLDSNAGLALVYHRDGDDWVLESTLAADDAGLNATFGWSVDIDDDRAIVGAFQAVTSPFISGAAYIFERTGTTWTQMIRLTGEPTLPEDGFGSTVSISGDWAAVGAPLAPPPSFTGPGTVYLFQRGPDGWVQDTVLTAMDAANWDEFGTSVSIDGDRLIVGAMRDDDNGNGSGSAYVFVRETGSWVQEAKLTAADGAPFDRFGAAVAISGTSAVVGADESDDDGESSGSAYIFEEDGGWVQSVKLTAFDATAEAEFGRAVGIDAGKAIVGAWLGYVADVRSGGAYVYRPAGAGWLATKLLPDDPQYGDGFGFSVGISGDCALVGAVNDDTPAGVDAGAAYIRCNIPVPVDPGFTVDIICCEEVPDPLGPVVFTTRWENRGPETVVTRRWAQLTGPDGVATRILGSESVVVPPGDVVEARHVAGFPDGAGPGRYALTLFWTTPDGVTSRTVTLDRTGQRR